MSTQSPTSTTTFSCAVTAGSAAKPTAATIPATRNRPVVVFLVAIAVTPALRTQNPSIGDNRESMHPVPGTAIFCYIEPTSTGRRGVV
jgi:hypothetical protein